MRVDVHWNPTLGPTCTGCGCLRPDNPVDCRLCPVPGCEGCIGDDGLCMTCRDIEKERGN